MRAPHQSLLHDTKKCFSDPRSCAANMTYSVVRKSGLKPRVHGPQAMIFEVRYTKSDDEVLLNCENFKGNRPSRCLLVIICVDGFQRAKL